MGMVAPQQRIASAFFVFLASTAMSAATPRNAASAGSGSIAKRLGVPGRLTQAGRKWQRLRAAVRQLRAGQCAVATASGAGGGAR